MFGRYSHERAGRGGCLSRTWLAGMRLAIEERKRGDAPQSKRWREVRERLGEASVYGIRHERANESGGNPAVQTLARGSSALAEATTPGWSCQDSSRRLLHQDSSRRLLHQDSSRRLLHQDSSRRLPSTRCKIPWTRIVGGVPTRTCRSEAPSDTTNCNKSDIEYDMAKSGFQIQCAQRASCNNLDRRKPSKSRPHSTLSITLSITLSQGI
jgi:hypothetical protein